MTNGDVWAALAVAAVLVAALAKPKKTLVGGWLVKGKRGEMLLRLVPAKRKKK